MKEISLTHSFSVSASRDEAWAFLWDIETVARCIPGCQEVFVKQADSLYGAIVRRKAGPFLIGMELDIRVLQRNPPEAIVAEVVGSDRRLKSEVRQLLEIRLNPETDGTTVVVRSTTV